MAKLRLRLCYYGRTLPHFLGELPTALVVWVALWLDPLTSIHAKPKVCSLTNERAAEFFDIIASALKLIANRDPVRYRRVQAQIQTIVYLPWHVESIYTHLRRACVLNLWATDKLRYKEMSLAEHAACLLVYYSSHAALFSRYVPLTGRNFKKRDLICLEEMGRFAEKARIGPYRDHEKETSEM